MHLFQLRLRPIPGLALHRLGVAMAKPLKLTPELYFPCWNCGQWRRQHVGKARKCLFQASHFQAKLPLEFSVVERTAVIDRLNRLDMQKGDRMRRALDAYDRAINLLRDIANFGCVHVDEAGNSLLERVKLQYDSLNYYITCSLCGEDWYENEKGEKLQPLRDPRPGE